MSTLVRLLWFLSFTALPALAIAEEAPAKAEVEPPEAAPVKAEVAPVEPEIRPVEPAPASASVAQRTPRRRIPVSASFVPGLSTLRFSDRPARTVLHVAALGAHLDETEGLTLSGIWHHVEGRSKGASVAGAVASQGGGGAGLGVGGVGLYSGGDWRGLTVGGVFNAIKGDVRGAQLSGTATIAAGHVRGIQIGGVAAVAAEGIHGIQASGVSSTARGGVRGIQVAGVVNVAGDVRGVQAAGIVNVAKRVRGLQVGLINFAEHIDGVPIGLMSIVDDGLHVVEGAVTDFAPGVLSLKLGSHRFYNQWTLGVRPEGHDAVFFPGVGLGVHWDIGPMFTELGASTRFIFNEDFTEHHGRLHRLELLLGYRVLGDLAVVVGPALNVFEAEGDCDEDLGRGMSKLAPSRAWRHDEHHARIWPGAQAGLRF